MFKQSIRHFSTTFQPKAAKMSLIGTIGSDLAKQTTSTGKEFLKYSVAVNSKNKSSESVSWFNIACFNPAQIDFMSKYLAKGSKVYVEADVSNTSYEKEGGTRGYSLMLFQNNFEVIKYPKKKEETEQTEQ